MESAHFDSIKQIIIYHDVVIMSSLLSQVVDGKAEQEVRKNERKQREFASLQESREINVHNAGWA